MPQLDFYAFYPQNITIICIFFLFYFIFIKAFLVDFSKITKFRVKLVNSYKKYKINTSKLSLPKPQIKNCLF